MSEKDSRRKVLKNYVIKKKLGEGAFGESESLADSATGGETDALARTASSGRISASPKCREFSP